MHLCITCINYGGIGENGGHVCTAQQNYHFDPVTGIYHAYDCSWLRSPTMASTCGPNGDWWRPRPAPPEISPNDPPIPKDPAAGKRKGWRDWIRRLGMPPKGQDTRRRAF